MLAKDDKDGTIAFLRESLQKIYEISYQCNYNGNCGYADIEHLAETALNDTIW